MKKYALLFLMLFLPISAEATIKRYSRGYTDSWCADLTKTLPDGTVILAADPKDPTKIKGYCYAKSVTDWTNNTMAGHKTNAVVTMIGPTGIRADKATGLQVGITSATVQVPYYNWNGEFNSWFQVGEVYCPFGQMTAAGIFSNSRKRLGVSVICLKRDGNPRKAVKPIIGPQLGWITGYWPIDPCDVKCVANHYSIFVAGSGTPDAKTGTAHKGFSVDLDTGFFKCEGFAVSFVPDGIPGILPCASKGCVENIIDF